MGNTGGLTVSANSEWGRRPTITSVIIQSRSKGATVQGWRWLRRPRRPTTTSPNRPYHFLRRAKITVGIFFLFLNFVFTLDKLDNSPRERLCLKLDTWLKLHTLFRVEIVFSQFSRSLWEYLCPFPLSFLLPRKETRTARNMTKMISKALKWRSSKANKPSRSKRMRICEVYYKWGVNTDGHQLGRRTDCTD